MGAQRPRDVLALCLAPFVVALVAAALRRYPYGGVTHGSPARIMQFLAPSICLLAGIGLANEAATLPRSGLRPRMLRLGVILLVLVGIVPLAVEARHPYRAIQAERARAFAQATSGPISLARCVRGPSGLRWDLGLGKWDSTDLNVAVYLCNQRIYSPARVSDRVLHSELVSAERPLRCVESLAHADDRQVAAWLETMQTRYDLHSRREIAVDTAESRAPTEIRRRYVASMEFTPKDAPAMSRARYEQSTKVSLLACGKRRFPCARAPPYAD